MAAAKGLVSNTTSMASSQMPFYAGAQYLSRRAKSKALGVRSLVLRTRLLRSHAKPMRCHASELATALTRYDNVATAAPALLHSRAAARSRNSRRIARRESDSRENRALDCFGLVLHLLVHS